VPVTNTVVTVATTETVVAAVNPLRRTITFHNASSNTIFVGGSGVTTTNGHPVAAAGTFSVLQAVRGDTNAQQVWYGIVAASTEPLRVLSVSD